MVCGSNSFAQLGVGNAKSLLNSWIEFVPPVVFLHISCGNSHTIALAEGGSAWGWGSNTCGQLGLGHMTSPVISPKKVVLDEKKDPAIMVNAGNVMSALITSSFYVEYSFSHRIWQSFHLGIVQHFWTIGNRFHSKSKYTMSCGAPWRSNHT